MKPDLKFRFLTDTTTHTLRIRREFAAGRALVWDCYTKSELLEKWFAPTPLVTKTTHMDFSEGGYWHYAMVDPEGTHYWGRMDYRAIEPVDRYSSVDSFTDETGTPNPDMPSADWDVTFEDAEIGTLVSTTVQYASAEDLQKVIDMGMEAGLASALENLDALLATLDSKGSAQ
ncbi:SRPBCC family protein [Sinisalibacter aestuarii]|uniref:Activator of Hsp90 ATPase homologue 1/2-like C-terminal domain-containing protein n=1 Tax=Sinisalibacter aestuarii TaxID=2949426 RepID=A0ABQ5LU48_9RHOB|nr:SRPBCC domain-containing protein [Sinisalibacter aestuarii]GKY88497.1 hypothetical protein STA1M1_23660 [Sinisalibacter aestuarii]